VGWGGGGSRGNVSSTHFGEEAEEERKHEPGRTSGCLGVRLTRPSAPSFPFDGGRAISNSPLGKMRAAGSIPTCGAYNCPSNMHRSQQCRVQSAVRVARPGSMGRRSGHPPRVPPAAPPRSHSVQFLRRLMKWIIIQEGAVPRVWPPVFPRRRTPPVILWRRPRCDPHRLEAIPGLASRTASSASTDSRVGGLTSSEGKRHWTRLVRCAMRLT